VSGDARTRALESLRHSLQSGRLAPSYLVQGSPRGDGIGLVEDFLADLFAFDGAGRAQVAARLADRSWPDAHWVEPESKSRVIRVDEQIRPLIQRLSQTSFSGGWRAGVILWADRLNDQSANALLKTLEEPPERCVLFLVTESPASLLPTIRSRCRILRLPEPERPSGGCWSADLTALLAGDLPVGPARAMALAGRFWDLLEREQDRIEAEEPPAEIEGDEGKRIRDARIRSRTAEVRERMLRDTVLWYRDVMVQVLDGDPSALHYPAYAERTREQASGMDFGRARAVVETVEAALRRLDRNIRPALVFESAELRRGMIRAGVA
jgi:hypothetical protein